jgi:hypothetical protein
VDPAVPDCEIAEPDRKDPRKYTKCSYEFVDGSESNAKSKLDAVRTGSPVFSGKQKAKAGAFALMEFENP